MDRLLLSGLALMASCGGVVPTAAAPGVEHVPGTALNRTARAEIEASRSAPLLQSPAATAENAPEAAPTDATPTWSGIFARYLAVGTEGGCGRSGACHAPEMAQASSAYDWLEQRGYIAGTKSPIASASNSCLRWFGGNMPPRGKPNEKAARDLIAWVAAGAPND